MLTRETAGAFPVSPRSRVPVVRSWKQTSEGGRTRRGGAELGDGAHCGRVRSRGVVAGIVLGREVQRR